MRTEPVLRTKVLWEEVESPIQVVLAEVDIARSWRHVEARGDTDRTGTEWIRDWMADARRERLDLATAPLARLTAVTGLTGGTVLVWEFHHIQLDGWSMALLWGTFMQAVGALADGRQPVTPRRTPYRQFVEWSRSPAVTAHVETWRRRLRGLTAPTPLPLPPSRGAHGVTEIQRDLGVPLSRRIDDFCRQLRITPSILMQAAWALTLAGDDRTDVLFGVTVAGRPVHLPDAEEMVGLFINTIPVRIGFPAATSVAHWLKGLQVEWNGIDEAQYCALRDIQAVSEIPRPVPLFGTLLIYQNYPRPVRPVRPGAAESHELLSHNRSTYPVTLVLSSAETGTLRLRLAADEAEVDGAAVGPLAARVAGILDRLVGIDGDATLGQVGA